MRRYIVLLLITGIVWAQTDFDKLVLKDGTTYLGEYYKIEEEIVYFRHQDALAFQPISIKLIQTLQLKDGQFIIDPVFASAVAPNIPFAIEEYQKLSTKAKVIIGCGCIIVGFLIIGAVAAEILDETLSQ
jgi:hypothetical protein